MARSIKVPKVAGSKICCKCGIEKSREEFYARKKATDGLRTRCKSCESEDSKITRSKPESQIRTKAYKSTDEYKSKSREYMRKKLSDPDALLVHRERSRKVRSTAVGLAKCRAANLRYAKTHQNGTYAKYENDPLFKERFDFQRSLCAALKAKKSIKKFWWLDILGCSVAELKARFETMFTEGMTWQNMGEWHTDHIEPLKVNTSHEDFIRLSHYTNLQPMWAEYNRIKCDKSPEQWAEYCRINNINIKVKP